MHTVSGANDTLRPRQGGTITPWLMGLLATALVALGAKTITDGERVARVEQQVEHLDRSLDRIEAKLDELLSRAQPRR